MANKLGPWHPPEIKPVHAGVYETRAKNLDNGYSWWNGHSWGIQYPTPGRACRERPYLGLQNKQWRGVLRDAS